MNLANYNSMVANNFDKMAETDKNVSDLANKYNPQALQEKLRGFKFAKVGQVATGNKDTNWFSKLNTGSVDESKKGELSPMKKVGGQYKFEMSKEDNKKFNKEMV